MAQNDSGVGAIMAAWYELEALSSASTTGKEACQMQGEIEKLVNDGCD
jgi:hypothetical protein